ncbi:HAMP domain-containing protein [Streptosporangiaceae bacterium NEAU-GS5]|nr:HAMP domain-containing protein [Streptosporangiaceae bacterium NEAU-GS5]
MPVRWRLTLVHGSVFFLTAVVFVAFNYLFVNQIINRRFQYRVDRGTVVQLGTNPLPPINDKLFLATLDTAVDTYRDMVMNSLVWWSLASAAVIGLIGLAAGWLVARRALAPLQTVTETARRLSDSTLHQRISLAGPRDEIRELADTFDSMLERLDHAFDGQRRFVANASHELKTPLAIDRALLQVALADTAVPAGLRPVREELLASNARQERLIEGLLMLAQSEREPATREPVDLRDLAGGGTEPAPALGDPVLLERMIANLLDNADKYNDERGIVEIRTGVESGHAYVTVENTGAIVNPGQAAGLFEPFRRLERDRIGSATGAGLGLSIVRAIARAHGGAASAAAREGGGLVVTVRLPARYSVAGEKTPNRLPEVSVI